jgi:hypothetical protein
MVSVYFRLPLKVNISIHIGTKNQILTIVDESVVTSDKNLQEKQTIYEAVQGALNLVYNWLIVGRTKANEISWLSSTKLHRLCNFCYNYAVGN